MPTDHSRLRELFIAACDLPESEQAALLAAECADAPELHDELNRLLRKDASAQGILAEHDLALGIHLHLDSDADAPIPTRIGRYEIKRRIGEGGMGAVYLAEQENPRRNVAVKVIRSSLMSRELRRRFEVEAAVLGRLQHPGIAQVYEAGLYDNGSGARPFFAMEYVDGLLLSTYVRDRRPTVRDRLAMFINICEAVNHAHQRGIIHRDLKPGNILVVEGESSGHDDHPGNSRRQPAGTRRASASAKVLDFGVARATDSDLQVSTLRTDVGRLIGTLPYMSPEQVAGRGCDVDTRSDVYALGVILYEMLTQRLPYDLPDRSIVTAARVIAEQEPISLTSINRVYRGDLNTIVLKALEKDPDQRYPSAAALAADVQRYLDDEPIVARPATTIYQWRKFARRNKALVSGVAATMLALVAGVIGTTAAMLGAQKEADRVSTINEFMRDILVEADPSYGEADVRLVEVLRDASDGITARFQEHPLLEAEVRKLLGDAFRRLALSREAIIHHQRAYELMRAEYGLAHRATRKAGAALAFTLLPLDAEAAIAVGEEVLSNTPADERNEGTALWVRRDIASAQARLGDHDFAVQELRELLAMAREEMGPDARLSIETSVSLGSVLRRRVHHNASEDPTLDLAEAIELFRDALPRQERTRGADDANTLNVMLNLVDALRYSGEYEEAESLARRVLQRAPARFGPDHDLCIKSVTDLSYICFAQGRHQEAARYRIDAVDMTRRRLGDRSIDAIVRMTDGLKILDAAGELEVGEEYARFLMDYFADMTGPNHVATLNYQSHLARFLSRQGRAEEAEEQFSALLESVDPEKDPARALQVHHFYGVHLVAQQSFEEAERHLLRACEIRRQNPSIRRPEIYDAAGDLAALYDAWAKPERAAAIREAG